MGETWGPLLTRWIDAGVLDEETAARIRAFELAHADSGRLRWPIRLALVFGALAVGAGALPFVSAHWDALSPQVRFTLVAALVTVFHVGGAMAAERFPAMAATLHAIGTVSLVAALHVAIVASLGAKLLVDRATRPRVWARAAPVDPNLPIRGRYVRLNVEAVPSSEPMIGGSHIALSVRDGQLVATPAGGASKLTVRFVERGGDRVAVVNEPLAYFIPEHVADPSRRPPGEELWVEVTLPRAGAPRPIQLGVKKDGMLTPLDVK